MIGEQPPPREWKDNEGKPIIFDGVDLSDSLLSRGPGKRDSFIFFASQVFSGVQELQGALDRQRHLAWAFKAAQGICDLRSVVGPR